MELSASTMYGVSVHAQCYNINDNVILWTTVRKNLRIMKELYSLI